MSSEMEYLRRVAHAWVAAQKGEQNGCTDENLMRAIARAGLGSAQDEIFAELYRVGVESDNIAYNPLAKMILGDDN